MTVITAERIELSSSQSGVSYLSENGRNSRLSLNELENLWARQHVERYGSLICTPSGTITLTNYPELKTFITPGSEGVHPLVLRFTPDTLAGLDRYFAIVVEDRQRHTDEMLGKWPQREKVASKPAYGILLP